MNKTIQFYHPNPTDPTTTTTDPTTDPTNPANPIDLFSDIPLTNSQPPWNPQDHSSPPSEFFEPSLKNHPLPTNAWWQNLGNFLASARIKVVIRAAVIDKTGKIMVLPRFYRRLFVSSTNHNAQQMCIVIVSKIQKAGRKVASSM